MNMEDLLTEFHSRLTAIPKRDLGILFLVGVVIAGICDSHISSGWLSFLVYLAIFAPGANLTIWFWGGHKLHSRQKRKRSRRKGS